MKGLVEIDRLRATALCFIEGQQARLNLVEVYKEGQGYTIHGTVLKQFRDKLNLRVLHSILQSLMCSKELKANVYLLRVRGTSDIYNR